MVSLQNMYKQVFKRKYTYMSYMLAFFIPICVFLFLYWLTGTEPFGNNTIASGDMINQYLALISYFRSNVFHIGNLIYSYQVSLGDNFFSVWTYYLMSPFNLLAIFFKTEQMPLFFELNTLFDAGLASLTMSILLRNSSCINYKTNYDENIRGLYAAIFSTAYALMSFIFAYKESIFWYNAIALMPLVILGFERLIKGKGPTLYWVMLSVTILVNYYIGIMIVLFIFIISVFFIIYKLLNRSHCKDVFLLGVKIFSMTVLSLMISSIALLPSILGQEGVAKEPFNFKFDYIYQPFHLMAGLFTRSHFQDSPLIYTCLLVTLLVFTYFRITSIKQKDKNLLLAFLVVLFISTWLNTFYMMWHGFTMPNGYINREAFCVAFTLIVIGYSTLGLIYKQQNMYFKTPLWMLIITLLVLVQVVKAFSGLEVLMNILGLAIGSILIALVQRGRKPFWVAICVFLFVLIDISYSNYPMIDSQAKASPKRSAYRAVVQKTSSTISKIKKKDNDFYRIGSSFELNPNDPLQFNYAGISSYVSQQPTEYTDYMSALGYYQKHGWTRWTRYNNGSTLFMDSFLGVKYILSATDSEFSKQLDKTNNPLKADNSSQPFQYKTLFLKGEGNINVYKNRYFFPLAFAVSKGAQNLSLNYDTAADPFKIQNKLWTKMFKTSSLLYSNQSYQKNVQDNRATFSFTTNHSGLAYIYVPTQKWVMWPSSLKLSCNGKNITTLFGNNEGENGIVCLGRFDKGTMLKVALEPTDSSISLSQLKGIPNLMPYIDVENDKLLGEVRSKRIVRDNVMIKRISGPNMTFETDKDFKGGNILVTVPYDSGWRSEVDGEKTVLGKGLGHFIMIGVSAGKHEIKLSYSVKGLKTAVFLSVIGFVLAIISSIISSRSNRKKIMHTIATKSSSE